MIQSNCRIESIIVKVNFCIKLVKEVHLFKTSERKQTNISVLRCDNVFVIFKRIFMILKMQTKVATGMA